MLPNKMESKVCGSRPNECPDETGLRYEMRCVKCNKIIFYLQFNRSAFFSESNRDVECSQERKNFQDALISSYYRRNVLVNYEYTFDEHERAASNSHSNFLEIHAAQLPMDYDLSHLKLPNKYMNCHNYNRLFFLFYVVSLAFAVTCLSTLSFFYIVYLKTKSNLGEWMFQWKENGFKY